jgi:Plasmid pRiA4b ORF-3-like protein
MAGEAKVIPLRPDGSQRAPRSAFLLCVTLRDVTPPIWRRIRVASVLTVRDLHHVLQIAVGWSDSHLHEFEIEGKRYGIPDRADDRSRSPLDEQDYRLGALLRKGMRLRYLYDLGDEWWHDVIVEDTASPPPDAPKAECLGGERACPPEDCHGPLGYRDLLGVLASSSKRSAQLREWVGPDFAPEKFDLASVNGELRGAGSESWRRKREELYAR